MLGKMTSKRINIKKLLPRFETYAEAVEETCKRKKILAKSHRGKDKDLAAKLDRCSRKNRCKSAACSICFREFRMNKIPELVKLSNRTKKAYILTIIYYEGLTNKELFKVNLNKYKHRLRKQLKRANFADVVIGSIEFDFHAEFGMWLPHFHLLVLGDKAPIQVLRKRFYSNIRPIPGRSSDIYRPVHIQKLKLKLKDKFKQLSYLIKSYCSRIEVYRTPKGKRSTKKYGLKANELRLSLRVMDRVGYSGLLFLYGVRLHGSELI